MILRSINAKGLRAGQSRGVRWHFHSSRLLLEIASMAVWHQVELGEASRLTGVARATATALPNALSLVWHQRFSGVAVTARAHMTHLSACLIPLESSAIRLTSFEKSDAVLLIETGDALQASLRLPCQCKAYRHGNRKEEEICTLAPAD